MTKKYMRSRLRPRVTMQMIRFEEERKGRDRERRRGGRGRGRRGERPFALRFVERGRRDVRRQTKDTERYLRPTD